MRAQCGRPSRRVRAPAALLGLGAALLVVAGASAEPAPERAGVFVLGVDGMDPVILRRLMAEGRVPALHRLARDGTFQELATTAPPQSPVAWSTFVTGRNPGGHGIFDFIHRDPKRYAPVASSTRLVEGGPPPTVHVFDYVIPVGGTSPEQNRSGTPFWDVLADAGVDVEVYRIPANFPPPPSDARTLSGMGTVDLRGELGAYTWYTNAPLASGKNLKADYVAVTLEDSDLDGVGDSVHERLKGPPDVFKLGPGVAPTRPEHWLFVKLGVHVDPVEDVAWIRLPEGQAVLRVGEWSEWLPVSFDALPYGLVRFHGNVRFYLKSVRPTFALYASPVNLAPGAPAQAITTPDEWAVELDRDLGPFYTAGLPEETNALKDGLFDDDDYLKQVTVVHGEAERMLTHALERFEPGDTTFFYLSEIDLQSHVLWRHHDPKHPDAPPHPAFDPSVAPRHAGDIERFYERVDRLVGTVRAALPPETLVVVLSDHGFETFTRAFHLNDWLRARGWLVLKDGKTSGHLATSAGAGEVDWSRSRAYGLGFNGVYLNVRGREADGIVEPEEADALAREIAAALAEVTDPATGRRVVRRVDRARDVYSGPRLAEAPDLVVGYDRGYGCSDASTLGQVGVEASGELIVDNVSRWSGNHLMAPEVVPGVLLVNRVLPRAGHGLADVTATLLDVYGIAPVTGMDGRSVLR